MIKNGSFAYTIDNNIGIIKVCVIENFINGYSKINTIVNGSDIIPSIYLFKNKPHSWVINLELIYVFSYKIKQEHMLTYDELYEMFFDKLPIKYRRNILISKILSI